MREEVPGISRLPQITHETTTASRRLPCMQTGIAQYFFIGSSKIMSIGVAKLDGNLTDAQIGIGQKIICLVNFCLQNKLL